MEKATDIYKTFAQLVLPNELLEYFDIVNLEDKLTGKMLFGDYLEKELHIYLDEKPTLHQDDEGYKSNGFTEETLLYDFPIRDRKAILHVRRRRWINPQGRNEVMNYGDLLGAKGTKLSREFAAFLKESH